MKELVDSFHRPINYLRISVTDRCNLRCIYCQPANGIKLLPREKILRYEEIIYIAKIAAQLGINKIRLTGGEPLVRAGLLNLVSELAAIEGIDDISLTTNAILLKEYAYDLKKAGLKRVNISLDSLQAEKFNTITRLGNLDHVLQGIESAKKAELNPVKINVVVMRGINDDETIDFAQLSLNRDWHIRFIELMPFGGDNPPEEHNIGESGQKQQFVSISEIRQKIETLGKLEPAATVVGNGPAKYFRLPGAKGTIGFIGPVSEHFCFSCNRLRLTADGKLRPCLLSDYEVDLGPVIRQDRSPEQVKRKIIEAIENKPRKHDLENGMSPKRRRMSQVGG